MSKLPDDNLVSYDREIDIIFIYYPALEHVVSIYLFPEDHAGLLLLQSLMIKRRPKVKRP